MFHTSHGEWWGNNNIMLGSHCRGVVMCWQYMPQGGIYKRGYLYKHKHKQSNVPLTNSHLLLAILTTVFYNYVCLLLFRQQRNSMRI